MTDKQQIDHTILLVDDEPRIGRSLGRLLKKMGLKYVFMESAEQGLEWIQKADKPFSIIISDQRMPGMQGAQFLEQARALTPDTIRFLLTGYADVDAVTDAVNKGAIHRYIGKPWDKEMLKETIRTGLEQYELTLETHRLFTLAKAQNKKLYAVNKELQKSTGVHKKALRQRDREIAALKKRLAQGFERRSYISDIEAVLREKELLETDKLNRLYMAIMEELFEQFQDIATRNGFEMPEQVHGG